MSDIGITCICDGSNCNAKISYGDHVTSCSKPYLLVRAITLDEVSSGHLANQIVQPNNCM